MDQSDLPPEILTQVFELGFYAWGIQFLRPLLYVCKYWQEIIEGTPQFWSTIVVKSYQPQSLESLNIQITKAKESPLSISLLGGLNGMPEPVITRLISLSHQWRHASLTTSTFALCRWANLCTNLEELRLSRGRPVDDDPRDFFGDPDTHLEIKLQSFTALELPKAWIFGLLGPSIRQFCFRRGCSNEAPHNICDTFQYLSRINAAVVIDLENIYHSTVGLHTLGVAHLNNLQTLRLSDVLYTPALLCSISAPSLQILYIECLSNAYNPEVNETMPMAPFFSQWSQSGFVPVNLHTLQLETCLKVTDVPLLISWLAHLPNIVCLFLRDEAISQAATTLGQDANLYKALASPLSPTSAVSSWLCPSLMDLRVDTDELVADLIPIARARGGIASPDLGIPSPSRLRRIEAILCPTAEPGEKELLESLVDQATCFCNSCPEHGIVLYGSRLFR